MGVIALIIEGMFNSFRKRSKRMQPEAEWQISIDIESISVTDNKGAVRSAIKTDLSRVIIETNDSGPWGADVWWLLLDANDELLCSFPQGATGQEAAVDYLMSLSGFDYEQMIKAMASADNAVFPVWRKTDQSKPDERYETIVGRDSSPT